MSPVSTRLAMTRRAIAAATIPPRPRRLLVTRDHDQNGSRLHFRARSCADFGDATGGWREQLVLHLHRLQRGERGREGTSRDGAVGEIRNAVRVPPRDKIGVVAPGDEV